MSYTPYRSIPMTSRSLVMTGYEVVLSCQGVYHSCVAQTNSTAVLRSVHGPSTHQQGIHCGSQSNTVYCCWCVVCTTETLSAKRHMEYDCVRIHGLCCCQHLVTLSSSTTTTVPPLCSYSCSPCRVLAYQIAATHYAHALGLML